MDGLHDLSATQAIRRFRARELSPVELVTAVIERAERIEPAVNAFTYTYYDRALEQAKRAEARYLGRGPRPRPLEGIPVGLKDEVPIEGEPWSQASLAYRDMVADHTAPIAERIARGGGIVHARTTTPEFSCAGFTHSRLWGVTRNPWNLECAVGGSSGGSGAALAAGSATLATGSDIGGSIRVPAAFNGVVGFKPPFGRVASYAPWNLDHYCVDGPMARTVADAALLQNVIAGPHPHDPASLRPKLRIPVGLGGIDGWRVALSVDLGCYDVDGEVAANARAAAEGFREAGAVVEPIDLGWSLDDIRRASMTHFGAVFGAAIQADVEQHPELLTPYAIRLAERTKAAAAETSFAECLEIEARIYARLGELLERYRILICPTVAVPWLVAGDDYVDHGVTIGGVEHPDYFDALMTVPFNICGRCPVMSVPSGFSRAGVPTGIQIVGRTYDDVGVFRAAAAYERARPWLDAPERRPSL